MGTTGIYSRNLERVVVRSVTPRAMFIELFEANLFGFEIWITWENITTTLLYPLGVRFGA